MNRLDRFLLNVANGVVPDGTSWSDEARAIIDERFLTEARELACDVLFDRNGEAATAYRNGEFDDSSVVKVILKALRRGASFGEI